MRKTTKSPGEKIVKTSNASRASIIHPKRRSALFWTACVARIALLSYADTTWADIKVMVTNPDGTTTAKTLDELGITEIDLMGSAANIELPDGSVITGTTTFTMNGATHSVGEMSLATDGRGYRKAAA